MSDTGAVEARGQGRGDGYTALFLASDESSYITGTDIVVDGGWVTAAPHLGGDRRHHMLDLLRAKEAAKDKQEAVEEFLRRHLQEGSSGAVVVETPRSSCKDVDT